MKRALLIALMVVSVFSLYLYLRRGYYNLYIINKVFGSAAVVLAALTLAIGPLRSFVFGAHLMTIRKQLGLTAFGLAAAHVGASLLQYNRFSIPSWYFEEWLPIAFGILAMLVWTYMTFISRNSKITEMGADRWKKSLSLAGKLGFIAIFLHITMMKYQGWIKWWNGQIKVSPELANPNYPPASIFVFIIMLYVIFYRIFHYLTHNNPQEYHQQQS